MKKLILIIMIPMILAAIPSCVQQDIVGEVDFSVTLDSANVFRIGEPVRFNFTGDADYIVFYSGETGHEFCYKDRTDIPVEDIEELDMTLQIMTKWGMGNAFDIFITDRFEGLNGNDVEADRKYVRDLVESGMDGWYNLGYKEGEESSWTYSYHDVLDYSRKFSLAFHWHPERLGGLKSQGTYYVNGTIDMKSNEGLTNTISLNDLDFDTIMVNEEDPGYMRNIRGDTTSIGTICFTDSHYNIKFEGCSGAFIPYNLEGWAISKPVSLNTIPSDTGQQIKNMMNPIFSYTYIYDEPGTYEAVFFGVNDNYQGSSSKMVKVKVIVIDDPVFQQE